MNKDYALFIIGLVAFFGLGFLVASTYYAGTGETRWERAYTVSEMVGSSIMSPQGEEFGTIKDFVIDTNGRVPFTVLSYGEKLVAIPFETLTYSTEKKHLVFDLGREKLDSAPAFDKSVLADRTWVEDTYRLFGQAPYWTEGGLERTQSSPMEAPDYRY